MPFVACIPSAPAAPIPTIQIGIGDSEEPQEVAKTLQIAFILTILALAPSILIMMTSFTRIIIVFSFLRHALNTQQMPSNQILIGMALFLTFYIMAPVWQKINDTALQPYMNEQIPLQEALHKAAVPLREFMLKQTKEKDLELLVSMTKGERPRTPDDIPFTTIIPAFMISEVSTAFSVGFLLYIPFLVIDMVVACVLLSMGMMMLPPVMISLPFKILLFVLVDGWNLLIASVIKSFH
ncbi:MAG: flagellar type III secretion system pore protein FliP [Desulfobacterota bacterium]|nr:flagellar type III secretion system pore protein FliP [Thermodesulfobacteriota bacterium]